MSGFNLICKIRDIETRLDNLGMVMCRSKFAHTTFDGRDIVAVKPKDSDGLFARDAEFYSGTIEMLEEWLRGVEWARGYDALVFGKKHNDNRARKEQDYRNSELLVKLKNSHKQEEEV